MPYCCVINCKNHSGRNTVANSGVSYHRFPTDYDVKQKWIEAAGRKDTDWTPQKTSVICSKHFEDDVIYMSGKMRRMPEDAVPTLNLPVPITNLEEQSNDYIASDEDKIPTDDEIYEPEEEEVGKRKKPAKKVQGALDRANKLIKKQTLIIKRLREQNRRDSKKITLQNKILNDLMAIYGLKNEDIAVLRTEILKSEELDSS